MMLSGSRITSYSYNAAGELTGIDYSGTTPDVSFTRDRFGRPTSITDGTGSRALSYNDDSSLSSEAVPYISGHSVAYSYDNIGRRSQMQLTSGSGALTTAAYGYDGMSRLASVSGGSSPTVTASYSRVSGSSLLASTSISNGSSNVMTVNRSYDSLNRLSSISSASSVAYSYTYNTSDKRIKSTLADSSYWAYTYDQYGQVTSGKKYDSNDVEVPNQQFGYAFDSIGNRQSENRNGHTFTYTPNNVNQYTQRTVPGAIDISGVAETSAKVTIQKMSLGNTAAAFSKLPDRTSRYFSKDYVFDNSINPASDAFKIFAVGFDQTQNKDIISKQLVDIFIPKTPEPYTYDPDGNLTSDGRFTYNWDAENRLVSVESISSILPANKIKVVFAYDYMNRRVEKKLYKWQNNYWNLTSDVKSVYDGMNVIAEFDAVGNTLLKSYTWGLDLSGSIQGAGGVGGLVCVRAGTDVYFPVYDGNGNVMSYLDSSGNKVAEFEYSPDPRIIVKSGPKADELSGCASFSTKAYDKDLDSFIYPFRILKEGRWLSRDLIGERGGINLYTGNHNDFVNRIDPLGLWSPSTHRDFAETSFGMVLPAGNYSQLDLRVIQLIRETLAENDAAVDSRYFRNEEYHFTRSLAVFSSTKEVIREAKAEYLANIKNYIEKFGKEIANNPKYKDCMAALKDLGTVSHPWQDYYSHAVINGDEYIDIDDIGTITGSPDSPGEAMQPVSFDLIWGGGAHGWIGEPGEKAPDSASRKNQAKDFVAGKYQQHLIGEWWPKCFCIILEELQKGGAK